MPKNVRKVGSNPLPASVPAPDPDPSYAPTLSTPPVKRPLETDGMSTRFALGVDRPD